MSNNGVEILLVIREKGKLIKIIVIMVMFFLTPFSDCVFVRTKH